MKQRRKQPDKLQSTANLPKQEEGACSHLSGTKRIPISILQRESWEERGLTTPMSLMMHSIQIWSIKHHIPEEELLMTKRRVLLISLAQLQHTSP
jgi:hypothetical protein